MLIGPSKNIANNGKGMYVGLKQPLGDGERCVTPARAAAKETIFFIVPFITRRKPLRDFSAKENIETPNYAVIGAAYTIARC